METFEEYFETIDGEHGDKMRIVFDWIEKTYPNLVRRVAWNQPMYTDHGTFIIGFSQAKKHMSITPEGPVMPIFSDKIKAAGYEQTKMLFKIKWDQEVNYDLLAEMIEYNMEDKKDCETFWRK